MKCLRKELLKQKMKQCLVRQYFSDLEFQLVIMPSVTCVNFDVMSLTFGPRQANLVFIAYASNEGSGEPAHPRSLARTSAARSYKQ